MKKLIVLSIALAVLLSANVWSRGEPEPEVAFPTREIEIYVGFAAGGGTDVLARRIAEGMEPELGVPVIIDNRPGAGGLVAVQQVVNARPNGYTLAIILGNQFLQKHFKQADAWMDPLTEVTLIGVFNRDAWGIAVPVDAPYDTFSEFVDYARNNPGLPVGSGPPGTLYYWTWQAVVAHTGIDLTIVPYEGTALSLSAAAGEEVVAAGAGPGEAASLMDAGLVKMIGVAAEERVSVFPDIPTFREQGFDIVIGPWRGLVGPAGLPDTVRDRLANALENAYNSQRFQDFIREQGHGPFFRGPEDGMGFFREEDTFFFDLMDAQGQAR
ncbi:MAG: tripartite tricarboxylate transporter substrate binding protein [Spirochaetaceae bacterium]|nr:MAG: tripartite tricarboxylate transporter substrate binding protein [Spirochaetaceae bacterium]